MSVGPTLFPDKANRLQLKAKKNRHSLTHAGFSIYFPGVEVNESGRPRFVFPFSVLRSPSQNQKVIVLTVVAFEVVGLAFNVAPELE